MTMLMTGRLRAARDALTPAEWIRLSGMTMCILALNVLGWGIFAFAIQPHHFRYTGLGAGLGVALTAWTLGARHAFDADHISAIDNTTRKLMADGKRPLGTGFFFALGHSAIIVGIGIGLGFAAKAVFGAVVDPGSGYETIGGVVGTSMAAGFLYLIAALNVVVLAGILKVFRGLRAGLFDEAELERQLQARGLMWRFFGRFMRSITKTWHMFFVGLVFGIGFDTATEVLLLAATAAAASQGLPWYAVLALPLLFAGGMTLFDTADGCFMNIAYGRSPGRSARSTTTSSSPACPLPWPFSSAPSRSSACCPPSCTSTAASGTSWPASTSTAPGSSSPGCSWSSGRPPSPTGNSATSTGAGPPPPASPRTLSPARTPDRTTALSGARVRPGRGRG
jgi:high-affinity nickel-transport protein